MNAYVHVSLMLMADILHPPRRPATLQNMTAAADFMSATLYAAQHTITSSDLLDIILSVRVLLLQAVC
jgi:hypothetical protein